MEYITLVVADDEENIRNAVCKMIDWESEGIRICGSAKNGEEAFRKITEHNADAAILDIRMPLMSGLQVAERLKESEVGTKIIILSGYDDFNYAKEALVNGAVNYLLKPCRPEEILGAVKEVREQVLQERIRAQEEQEMCQQIKDGRYDLKNKWIANLILTSNDAIFQEASLKCGFSIKAKAFCFVVKPPDNTLFFRKQQQAIMNFLEKNMDCTTGCVAENIVGIVNQDPEHEKRKFREILIKLKNQVMNQFGISVSIGVGNMVQTSQGLSRSFQNAVLSLDMIYFLGTDFIIFYDSIYSGKQQNYPAAIESRIMDAIKQQNEEEVNRRVEEFFHASLEENGGSGFLRNAIAILLSLYHFSVIAGLPAGQIFGQPMELMDMVQRSRTAEEVAQNIKAQCFLIMKEMGSYVTENRFVNAAILIVKQNYYRDITLSLVADEIFITAGYLSTLFKQVTGDSFVNFLNQVRIEHACELLKDVRLKNYEAAYQVGFQDEKYFTKVFKKITGLSPSQYRKGEAAVR